MTLRAWLYQTHWLSSKQLPCRVISIGNLTVGGTGKTPFVIWLAKWLQDKEIRVGILSRGYGRSSRDPFLLVSDGEKVLIRPEEAGDEPYLMACRLPGVVVGVGADRYEAGLRMLHQYPVEYVILDDGFQHLGLARDENILLIDATDPYGLKHVLPAGRLRERLSASQRATHVIVTRVGNMTNLSQVLNPLERAVHRKVEPILSRFGVSTCVHVVTGEKRPIQEFHNMKTLIFSGIGNPQAFHTTVVGLDFTIVSELIYPDHYVYRETDIQSIRKSGFRHGAEILMTTEKDAVKLGPYFTASDPVWALCVEVEFLTEADRLTSGLLKKLDCYGNTVTGK